MEETTRISSRRGLLGRGLLVAAGALGLGAAKAAAAPAPSATELRLYGRQFHLHAPARRAGQLPEKGDRHTAYAELLDRPDGRVVGHFTAAHLTLDSPFAGASSLELHAFELPGGTIHGLGSVARGAEATSSSSGGPGGLPARPGATPPGSDRASWGATEQPSST